MPETRAQTLRNMDRRLRSSAVREKSNVLRGKAQKVKSHRRSYGPGRKGLKSRIICLKIAFGSTARHNHNSLCLQPELPDQCPQSTSQDVRDHVVGGLSSTSLELIPSAAHGRAIDTDGGEPDQADAPDVSSRKVAGNNADPAKRHDLSFSSTSSLLLKSWETVSKDLVSKVNGEESLGETGMLLVDAANAMAKPTPGLETCSEETDPAVELISSTSGGLATIRADQCEVPSWNSLHRGPCIDIGIYDSSTALPSRSLDERLADLMFPMAVEGSTLSTSNRLAGSGPVSAVPSIQTGGSSDPYQLRPSTSTNCVFVADSLLLPGSVPAEVGSVNRIALSNPVAGAIDAIDGVPLANLPLAPPQSVVRDGNMKPRDDDDDGSGSFLGASAHRNGINSQAGAAMWSSRRPRHVNHQHQHQDMKQASSDMPSRAISISTHVTDLHPVYPRWGTSLPDPAWLPALTRPEVEMVALTSPHLSESRGADIASTSRHSPTFHPSPSISTSFSASLLLSPSSSLLLHTICLHPVCSGDSLSFCSFSESCYWKTHGRVCDSLLQDREDVIRNPSELSTHKLDFTRTLYTPRASDALPTSKLITLYTPISE